MATTVDKVAVLRYFWPTILTLCVGQIKEIEAEVSIANITLQRHGSNVQLDGKDTEK
jgi:hypothetical protein